MAARETYHEIGDSNTAGSGERDRVLGLHVLATGKEHGGALRLLCDASGYHAAKDRDVDLFSG